MGFRMEATLSQRKKHIHNNSETVRDSFGAGLDEVGWKPQSNFYRLKPRMENLSRKPCVVSEGHTRVSGERSSNDCQTLLSVIAQREIKR